LKGDATKYATPGQKHALGPATGAFRRPARLVLRGHP
jgi:hypothetical protein